MTRREERTNTMVNAGMNTGKYFSLQLPEGLKPGATISLVINEDGTYSMAGHNYPTTVQMDDPIFNQIIEDGYVRNTKLHRRWVMAQTFRMMNYESYNRKEKGWDACLRNRYDYWYQFTMMLEEVRVLSKLEQKDKEAFEERSHFFTKDVVLATCEHYMIELKKYVDKLPVKKCKGVPYKRVSGRDIFVSDLNSKLYTPLYNVIYKLKYSENYTKLYFNLRAFMNKAIRLNWKTTKCNEWKDAFKGAGAYYTLKNLVMFHGCELIEQDGFVSRSMGAVKRLNVLLEDYQGEYWRMFALLKAVVKHNNFDFDKKMKEVYGKESGKYRR